MNEASWVGVTTGNALYERVGNTYLFVAVLLVEKDLVLLKFLFLLKLEIQRY